MSFSTLRCSVVWKAFDEQSTSINWIYVATNAVVFWFKGTNVSSVIGVGTAGPTCSITLGRETTWMEQKEKKRKKNKSSCSFLFILLSFCHVILFCERVYKRVTTTKRPEAGQVGGTSWLSITRIKLVTNKKKRRDWSVDLTGLDDGVCDALTFEQVY